MATAIAAQPASEEDIAARLTQPLVSATAGTERGRGWALDLGQRASRHHAIQSMIDGSGELLQQSPVDEPPYTEG